jgi:hypothetical protein
MVSHGGAFSCPKAAEIREKADNCQKLEPYQRKMLVYQAMAAIFFDFSSTSDGGFQALRAAFAYSLF